MNRTGSIWIVLALAGLYVLCSPPARARVAPNDPPALCHDAAHAAARETGVPVEVLMAVSLTETGRKQGGSFVPWPWTLNIAGDGHWFDTRDSATRRAVQTLQSGQQSFDVGCFQINYRWHGKAFASLEAMMDPRTNALYAARYLTELYQESGDWTVAAGHYHSRTPQYADRYRKVFARHLANLGPLPTTAPPLLSQQPPRENRYPLLQAGAPPASMGSLVPTVTNQGGGLFAVRSARSLWGQ